MSAPVDVCRVMRRASVEGVPLSQVGSMEDAREAFVCLLETAALVLAQAKEGKPMDLIALADCIDLAGGQEVRKAQRARVKGGAA